MAQQSGNERGAAERSYARRRVAGAVALVLVSAGSLAGCGGCSEASDAREWPPGTVVAIDQLPIGADEIAQDVVAVLLVEPQWGDAQLKRLAFNEISLPRAVLRLRAGEADRDRARRAIDEFVAKGSDPRSPPEGVVVEERTGSWRDVGLVGWGAAMGLEIGQSSEILEEPGAFLQVRLFESTPGPVPAATLVRLGTVKASYAERVSFDSDPDEEMARHRLTIVDPAWETIVPERTLYLMGARP